MNDRFKLEKDLGIKIPIRAEELNSTLYYIDRRSVKEMCKSYIKHGANDLLHKIGVFNLYKSGKSEFCISVNTETLIMLYFNTEEEAINFYLDKIEQTKNYKQTELFNQ